MTVIYCEGVKRGYEQTRAKELAHQLFAELELPVSLSLEVGDMVSERCVGVVSEQLHAVQQAMHER